jgi:hypothetical protein
MKRGISLLLILSLIVPLLVGCKWLRRFCRHNCVIVNSSRFVLRVGCRAPCTASVHAPGDGAASKDTHVLDQTIAQGSLAGASGACADVCREFGEESDECDQCRTTVGLAITQPYFNFCQGTAYQPLPDAMNVALEVDTDRGTFVSPQFTARKQRGTVRYDTCGGENADYVVVEETRLRDWGQRIYRESGARQAYEIRLARTGANAEESLFKLKDDFTQPAEAGGTLDPMVYGLNTSIWLFNGGGAGGDPDGVITPTPMLPAPAAGVGAGRSFSGEVVQSLKPCNTDADCAARTSCADDGYCRAK